MAELAKDAERASRGRGAADTAETAETRQQGVKKVERAEAASSTSEVPLFAPPNLMKRARASRSSVLVESSQSTKEAAGHGSEADDGSEDEDEDEDCWQVHPTQDKHGGRSSLAAVERLCGACLRTSRVMPVAKKKKLSALLPIEATLQQLLSKLKAEHLMLSKYRGSAEIKHALLMLYDVMSLLMRKYVKISKRRFFVKLVYGRSMQAMRESLISVKNEIFTSLSRKMAGEQLEMRRASVDSELPGTGPIQIWRTATCPSSSSNLDEAASANSSVRSFAARSLRGGPAPSLRAPRSSRSLRSPPPPSKQRWPVVKPPSPRAAALSALSAMSSLPRALVTKRSASSMTSTSTIGSSASSPESPRRNAVANLHKKISVEANRWDELVGDGDGDGADGDGADGDGDGDNDGDAEVNDFKDFNDFDNLEDLLDSDTEESKHEDYDMQYEEKKETDDDDDHHFQLGEHYEALALQLADQAIVCFATAAQAGSARAMIALGRLFEEGPGSAEVDLGMALHFLQCAADIDAAHGGAALALFQLRHNDNADAGVAVDIADTVRLLKRAACAGSPEAQNKLGELYNHGDAAIGKKNNGKARALFATAAAAEHPCAQNNLGVLLLDSADADEVGAGVKLLEQSAAKGFALAQDNLGMHKKMTWP